MSSSVCARRVAVAMPKEFLPHRAINGGWRPPKYSNRMQAEFRKRTLAAGQVWPWERQRPPMQPVVRKGVLKAQARREARKADIEQKMKEMPALVEKYYKGLAASRNREHIPVVDWTEEIPEDFSPDQYNPRAQVSMWQRMQLQRRRQLQAEMQAEGMSAEAAAAAAAAQTSSGKESGDKKTKKKKKGE